MCITFCRSTLVYILRDPTPPDPRAVLPFCNPRSSCRPPSPSPSISPSCRGLRSPRMTVDQLLLHWQQAPVTSLTLVILNSDLHQWYSMIACTLYTVHWGLRINFYIAVDVTVKQILSSRTLNGDIVDGFFCLRQYMSAAILFFEISLQWCLLPATKIISVERLLFEGANVKLLHIIGAATGWQSFKLITKLAISSWLETDICITSLVQQVAHSAHKKTDVASQLSFVTNWCRSQLARGIESVFLIPDLPLIFSIDSKINLFKSKLPYMGLSFFRPLSVTFSWAEDFDLAKCGIVWLRSYHVWDCLFLSTMRNMDQSLSAELKMFNLAKCGIVWSSGMWICHFEGEASFTANENLTRGSTLPVRRSTHCLLINPVKSSH